MKRNISKSLVLQRDEADCGVACLLSVIRYHGGDVSLESLRKLSGTSRQGATLLGLHQAAQASGLDAEGLEANSVANLTELTEPAILHVLVAGRLKHFVVYYPNFSNGGSDLPNKITIGDPGRGLVELTPGDLDKIWTSKALLALKPNNRFEKKEMRTGGPVRWKWIARLIKDDTTFLSTALVLGVVMALLGVSTAILSEQLVDDILPKGDVKKLTISLLFVGLLLLARTGLNFLRGLFVVRQGLNFNNRTIGYFYGNLIRLPKFFFDTRKIGELVARMNDTRRVQTAIATLVGNVAIDLLVMMVSIGFIFVYAWQVGVLVVSSLPVYFFVWRHFNKPLQQRQRETVAGYAMAESNFIDNMQGIAEIKLSGREQLFERINKNAYGQFQEAMATLGDLNARFIGVSEVVGVLLLVGIFGVSASLAIGQELWPGEMIAIIGIGGNIVPSISGMVFANVQIQEANVVLDRMFEFTSLEKETDTIDSPSDIKGGEFCSLKLEKVSFRFPGRKLLLRDISIKIGVGEIVALSGESGGGKSTILQLIQKFYEPEGGSITVGDSRLDGMNTMRWRSLLGCVPQDVKIFNGALIFNIALSEEPADCHNAIAFCEEMGFGRYFNAFPQNYYTSVGEEGMSLSGGQKQLVGLARALFRWPKLLLLDEATAGMDQKTEEFVFSVLNRVRTTTAILMVTHRQQAAGRCDRIYVVEDGETSICNH